MDVSKSAWYGYLTAFNALSVHNPAKPATLLTPAGEGMLAVVALPTGS